ncbi:DUF7946 domain-containing protein [Bradyrhizobium sp. CCGE-LA001]|uniref:DUF7946 domain-containing protein n=1 Tax=Bradyrhizobium sp. CCGE-LA001 TaxID=1223566 RepID=UPI001198262E|nr:hypothetical protein [Bradyrhizobium sp. CCGE-LA001]
MADRELVIKFTGDTAESHVLPAYEGSVSLRGLARSIVVIGNYLAEGEIRKRAPFSDNIRFYLHPPRPGSFESLITFATTNPEMLAISGLVGAVTLNVFSNFIWDGIKYCFNRVVGKDAQPETPQLARLSEIRGGDLDALVDAIESPAREAHTAIGQGAHQIFLITGSHNIVNLDQNTKRYITTTISDELPNTKLVSVGMFNVNTRYGRVFDYEFGKTVPFVVHRHAEPHTIGNISTSLDRYARKALNKDVMIKFIADRDIDDRVKRYVVLDAWFVEQ